MNHQKKEMRWGGSSKDHLPPADKRALCRGGNKYKHVIADKVSGIQSRLNTHQGRVKEHHMVRHVTNDHKCTTSRRRCYQDVQDHNTKLHFCRERKNCYTEMSINEEGNEEIRWGGNSKDHLLSADHHSRPNGNCAICWGGNKYK